MSLHRTAAKRDSNERQIVAALEAAGCSVDLLSGSGIPDLLICRGGAFVALAEVKAEHGTLTSAQVAWRAKHNGPPPVTLRSIEDAIQLIQFGPAGLTT